MKGRQASRSDRLGIAFRLSVVIAKPLLKVFTKRTWQGTAELHTNCGVVVAANHLSWVDPLVISHVLWDNDRPPRFLAKDTLFEVPVVGWILSNAGQIRVYRGSRNAASAVQDAVASAKAGECIVVYPEGTITKDPHLWPGAAKTGAARIALASGCPLIPMAQWGSHNIMRPYRKELRLLPRKNITISIGHPVDLDDLRERPLSNEVLQEATGRLMAAMMLLLEQIRGETHPDRSLPPEAS